MGGVVWQFTTQRVLITVSKVSCSPRNSFQQQIKIICHASLVIAIKATIITYFEPTTYSEERTTTFRDFLTRQLLVLWEDDHLSDQQSMVGC